MEAAVCFRKGRCRRKPGNARCFAKILRQVTFLDSTSGTLTRCWQWQSPQNSRIPVEWDKSLDGVRYALRLAKNQRHHDLLFALLLYVSIANACRDPVRPIFTPRTSENAKADEF